MVSAPFDNEQYRNQGNKAIGKPDCYQKVIICPSEPCRLSLPIAAQFLRCWGRSSLVTAVRFLDGRKAFLLTTAAQNMCNLCRKSPLCRKHFFGWLKTANISIVCGTVTLKSLLPQAFAVSNVHPRPRKRPPRCTLDCGFKTSESPALRGFVGERGRFATTSLYLVLKSNGLHRPKIRLKKFSFSLKIVPAYISKKLPSQRCPQPLLIPIFNFSHKWPTFAFTSESGYTRLFGEGSHTAAYTAKQGASLPRPQHGLELPAKFLLFHRAFIYIHFPVLCEPSTPAEENNPAKLPP